MPVRYYLHIVEITLSYRLLPSAGQGVRHLHIVEITLSYRRLLCKYPYFFINNQINKPIFLSEYFPTLIYRIQ